MTKLNKIPYIRVGTSYYKKINQPLASNDYLTRLSRWNITTIKQDETVEILNSIDKYDSFCIIPSHLNFKQVVGNSYNTYEPFEHKAINGDCTKSINFLEHIFGDQIEIGLGEVFDRLTILYIKKIEITDYEKNSNVTKEYNYLLKKTILK